VTPQVLPTASPIGYDSFPIHGMQILDLIAEDDRGNVYGHELRFAHHLPTAEAKSNFR